MRFGSNLPASHRHARAGRDDAVCSLRSLLNHLSRLIEDDWRNCDTELLGRLEINNEIIFGGLLHREIGGLGALEDLVP